MTDGNLISVNTKIKRVFKTTASGMLIAVMILVALVALGSNKAYAETNSNETNWAIKVGDQIALYVDSEETGNQIISELKKSYLSKGAIYVNATLYPGVDVVEINTAEPAVNAITEGIKIKDTLDSKAIIDNSQVKDAVEQLKESVEINSIEKYTSRTLVAYKTIYKKTSKVRKTVSKVSVSGIKGIKSTEKTVTKINDKTVKTGTVTKVERSTRSKVVLVGTGKVRARRGKTIKGTTGAEVVAYAKRFLGNPYVYGGTSLTRGADCSGFVMAVYRHFGVTVPRVQQTSVGKRVSVRNLKPGDILNYGGHMAIYAGNGKVIHAVNPRVDIAITRMNYTGRVRSATRIFSW